MPLNPRFLYHRLKDRFTDKRLFLLDRMPRHAVCAEIGVWKGEFSEKILRYTEPSKLYLVDPWAFQADFPDRMYGGKVAQEQEDMNAIFAEVRARLGGQEQVEICRAFSDEAAGQFGDEFFDWVYIDGNHFYEYVKRDLEQYYPTVKTGGYITGDDYDWGPEHDYPVKRAVDEFADGKQLQVIAIQNSQYILQKT